MSVAELNGQSDAMLGTLRESKREQPDKKPDARLERGQLQLVSTNDEPVAQAGKET